MEVIEIVKVIVREVADDEFDEEEPLIMTHCVDSIDIIEIASAMEKKFNVEIKGEEITLENFDSIKKMSNFILRKLNK